MPTVEFTVQVKFLDGTVKQDDFVTSNPARIETIARNYAKRIMSGLPTLVLDCIVVQFDVRSLRVLFGRE